MGGAYAPGEAAGREAREEVGDDDALRRRGTRGGASRDGARVRDAGRQHVEWTCPNGQWTSLNVEWTSLNVEWTCPNVEWTCPTVEWTCPNVEWTCPNGEWTCPNGEWTCPNGESGCPNVDLRGSCRRPNWSGRRVGRVHERRRRQAGEHEMTSTFTWLDHSDHERRRVLDAIDRFKETDTRDELGLGSIRDAFADHFFPGTSVIQTRARYFFFVPWMYLDMEKKKATSAEIEAKARKAETRLIPVLKGSEDPVGTLGARAGETLKRLPSNVYWLGLASWKIRTFDGSVDDYHRSLDRFYKRTHEARRDDDDELVSGALRRNWHPGMPEAPDGFPGEAEFALTRDEAGYLVDRLQLAAPRSLLAFLARSGQPTDADFAWMHPQLGEMSAEIQDALAHARLLAETMQGAAWLYNLLLAEERAKSTHNPEPVNTFRSALAKWAAELAGRRREIAGWDHQAFWMLVRRLGRVSRSTEAFVEAWLRLAPWDKADGGAADKIARELVGRREQQLKGARARLTNPRALELWGGNSGTGRLEYRWSAANRLMNDLYVALGRGDDDAATG